MIEELTLKKKHMTINQIKDKDIANCIKDCVIENKFWIHTDTIAKQLNVPTDAIHEIIQDSEVIVENGIGELTTRELYKKRTTFLNKLIDSIKNKID